MALVFRYLPPLKHTRKKGTFFVDLVCSAPRQSTTSVNLHYTKQLFCILIFDKYVWRRLGELFRRFYFIESLRSKLLPNLKKKSRRSILEMKKARDELRNFFLRFFIFSKIFDFFSKIVYRNS